MEMQGEGMIEMLADGDEMKEHYKRIRRREV